MGTCSSKSMRSLALPFFSFLVRPFISFVLHPFASLLHLCCPSLSLLLSSFQRQRAKPTPAVPFKLERNISAPQIALNKRCTLSSLLSSFCLPFLLSCASCIVPIYFASSLLSVFLSVCPPHFFFMSLFSS